MVKLYWKKTETERAVHIIKTLGMTTTMSQYTFGGNASEWGRILKGQHQAHGEYLAVCKEINTHWRHRYNHLEGRQKEIWEKNTKGGIVPRTKHVFNDLYAFNANRIIMDRIKKYAFAFADEYDEYIFYCEQGELIYAYGEQYPRTYFDDQTIRRDFLASLDT
jgi:nuclear transport factor 2 (NTF2) superfamily protein